MGLQDDLNTLLENSMKRIPEKTAAIMAAAMEEVRSTNLTDHSKRTGDVAPDFELKDALGGNVILKDLMTKGSVVISFYRGSW